MSSTAQRPIRILSFDGGGVRGLSSLILLRGLMERLSVKTAITPASIRPSDYFDLIVGTGTGGISAIFVGRMRMTVDEAINAYMRMAKQAFEPAISNPFTLWLWNRNPTLDGLSLQRVIGDIVQDVLGDRNAKLEDSSTDSSSCRTAILAARGDYVDGPAHLFRSYTNRQPASVFSIAWVSRATLSTSTAFRPISLGNPPIRFVDAGLAGYDNPVEVALVEAAKLWPETSVRCVVSLGTGLQRVVSVGRGWNQVAKACGSIIQSCELVHDRVFQTLSDTEYFRFNVDRGLEETEIMEWKESSRCNSIASVTDGYMSWAQVKHRLDVCVSVLSGEVRNVYQDSGKHSKRYLPSYHPAPEIFHGCEEYVDSAVNLLLQEGGSHLAILGPGGIGKTAIACTILHNPKVKSKFGNHRYFISCEGTTSTSMLVDTLWVAFSVKSCTSDHDHQNDLIMFLEHAHHSIPLLIILDNFETIWEIATAEVEEFLECLVRIAGISLLVTMRGTERPARVYWTKPWLETVKPLSITAAYATFTDICAVEDDKLPELLQELDCIPLAITLMAHLGQVEQPSILLERWKKDHTEILSPDWNLSPQKNVNISIHISIQSRRMQSCPEALILLSIIALLPGGVPRVNLDVITPNLQNCDNAVMTLLQTGLVYYNHAQILHVLSPICLYITKAHPPPQTLLQDLEEFYFQAAIHFVNSLGEEEGHHKKGNVLFSDDNMEAVLSKALHETNCDDVNFSTKIIAALNWTKYLQWDSRRQTIIQLVIKATQQCGQQEKHSLLYTQCLYILGDIQRILHINVQAQETLSIAHTRFEAIGDHLGAAQCLQSLGNIQQLLHNDEKAQQMFSIAKVKYETIDKQYGVAQCLRSLGDIQQKLNNLEKAHELFSIAKTKSEGCKDNYGVAHCLRGLGYIQQMLGNYTQALELLLASKIKFEAIRNQAGVAQVLQILADLQYIQGNYEVAQEIITTSKVKFEAIGDQYGTAHCLGRLGDIHQILGNYGCAQKMFFTAKTKFNALGYLSEVAWCTQHLEDIQHSLDDSKKGRRDAFS